MMRDVLRVTADVDGTEVVEHVDPTVDRRVVGTSERDHGFGRHGSAIEDDGRGRRVLAPVREDFRQRGVARAVEHDPERAVDAVLEDEDHGSVEVRIDERRSRDEELAA